MPIKGHIPVISELGNKENQWIFITNEIIKLSDNILVYNPEI